MYGKVFESMFDGTLASRGPWQALVTFQQMIVLANRDGMVDMTAEAISRRTSIPLEIIELGISELMKPDPRSRTPDEDGRRIVLIDDHRDWGWLIVNHGKYAAMRSAEERREYLRKAQADRRARLKQDQQVSTPVNTVNTASAKVNTSTDVPVDVPVPTEEQKTNPPLAGASDPPLANDGSRIRQCTAEETADLDRRLAAARRARPPAKPDDVEQQTWDDWLALRKAKKAPVTQTVLDRAKVEAEKAGLSLDGFLIVWCARGSQGLDASWLKPQEKGGGFTPGEPAWRREQRERVEQIMGKPGSKKPINMGEVFDVTAIKLG